MIICKCCGQEVSGDVDAVISEAKLSKFQGRLLQVLNKANRRWLTSHEIAESLYADRSDGGPDCARTTISVTIAAMKRKLLPHRGVAVIETRMGRSGGYRLVINGEM